MFYYLVTYPHPQHTLLLTPTSLGIVVSDPTLTTSGNTVTAIQNIASGLTLAQASTSFFQVCRLPATVVLQQTYIQ